MLEVAAPLQEEPAHIQEWVLWREAVLEHLVPHIRQVPEAADIGLYAGIKHGTKNPEHQKDLQQLWETVSPPQDYEYYRYYPTLGFAMFDNVVDGAFIRKAILWLNGMRGGKHSAITSTAYTAALERWMMEIQRILTAAELRVIRALASNPSISQKRLATQLGVTPGTLSPLIRRLASKHLLRVSCHLNFPLIGLHNISVVLQIPDSETYRMLMKMFAEIRYALVLRVIGSTLLAAFFLIPSPHVEEFTVWINSMCQTWNLPPPIMHEVTELVSFTNFQSYVPDVGWESDLTSTIELIRHAIKEKNPEIVPPLHSFKYTQSDLKEKAPPPLRLHPWDFTYFRRSTISVSATDTASARISKEARHLKLPKVEEKLYRRRVKKLSNIGIQTDPFQIGLIHIGLNASISLYIRSSREITELILRCFHMFPQIFGTIFDDGGAVITLYLPNPVAIEAFSSLRNLFAECGVDSHMIIRPAWQAFVYPRSPIVSSNYDFERQEWIWTSQTLIEP
ncbi:MAG: MarR family winged helix-turn-helix transcriptional regulator [Promethearchaeota archaeon]